MNVDSVRSTATAAMFVVMTLSFVTDARPRLHTSVDDVDRNGNQSSRQYYLRSDSKAAVITQRLPDMKTEVCRAERFEQAVKLRGCQRRTIVNRFCYGQCNSFYVPREATAFASPRRLMVDPVVRGRDRRRGGALTWAAFRSCSYCRPKTVQWVTIGLNCPHRRPSYRRRRVQIVKECHCAALTI